jgi:shikimate dehydrogenase
MIIDQHTDLYCVVGFPLSQTLGPIIHNTGFEVAGVNATYLAFETRDIEGCVKGMKSLGIKGMSVTVPFKSEVLPYLDAVHEMAKKIGAVNTIVNNNGRLIGYNTDALGALNALHVITPTPPSPFKGEGLGGGKKRKFLYYQDMVDLAGMKCLLLGAGGAARAIGFILKEEGVHLTIANRSPERGIELATYLQSDFVLFRDIKRMDEDILIQATPVGMHPNKDQCLIQEHLLNERMVVMDIIYNPPETRLLKIARKRGCRTINGLSMFIYQGAEQLRLWTGINPPINAMTRTVEEALNLRDK